MKTIAKQILASMLTAATVLSLAACSGVSAGEDGSNTTVSMNGSQTTSTDSSDGEKARVVIFSKKREWEEGWNQLRDRYMELHPDTEIVVNLTDASTYYDVLKGYQAAGDLPDIIQTVPGTTLSLWQEHLVPLNDLEVLDQMQQDIVDEYLSQIDEEERTKTYKLYRLATNKFMQFIGNGSLMEHITPIRMNQYISWLKKTKLSSTTINIYITLLKVIINYAIKMRYVTYDIDPFITARIPSAQKRETQITVEELKTIRDANLEHYNLNVTRDIFMLTYYLAGMNLVDILAYDFRTDEINYIRKKTKNTKEGDSLISFSIPEEAKPIIKKYMKKNTGKIIFGKYKNYTSCYNLLARKISQLGKVAGIRHKFTLYSARKSFVQHGYDLGIPLSTLEYCIGQSMKEDRPIFNYVTIMRKHADKAIREILDNLKNE